ncbi:MAG: histidine kinase [Cyclobacteriaceae bacterium]|jgi:sensor histidine kinase YesM|nr:histidine kinase [Cyclobacteriaceae bacterium]
MLNKTKLYYGLQLGGWLAYAIIQIVSSSLLSARAVSNQRIVFFFCEALICLLLTHGFRHLITQRQWLSHGFPRLIPQVILAVLLMGVLVYLLRLPVAALVGIYNAALAFDPTTLLGQALFYAIVFFIWSVLYFIYNYFERYNKSLKMEASLREVELNNLKSQLNPHFIFNALNSIRALVDENPGKSKQAINQLSNILRNSLIKEKSALASFDDELRMVRDYLSLESIRFEERLQIEYDIDPESYTFQVPPLMVQTLAENGIKHGISRLTQGGVIQLKTKVEDDHLKIYIRNSGHFDFKPASPNSTGLGIENTRQRLRLIYGDDASFRIITENNNFVVAELILPHIYRK